MTAAEMRNSLALLPGVGSMAVRHPARLADIAAGTAVAMLVSAVSIWLEPWLGLTTATLTMVLGVIVVGAMFGLAASVSASLVVFLFYNFFFVEPTGIFTFATRRDIAPFIAFSLVALITGLLAGRLKDREKATKLANVRLAGLLAASRSLQSLVMPESISEAIADGGPSGTILRFRTLTDAEILDQTSMRTFPVISAKSHRGDLHIVSDPLGVIDDHYLETVGTLIGLALDRADLAAKVALAMAQARAEELKTALLSSVSHDLRTPLTTIIASASSLVDYGENLPERDRLNLLRTIVIEGERLDRFTTNLLELSRLQAGAPLPTGILDPADIVSVAVARAGARLAQRVVGRVPSGAYLVQADAQLFEAAISNVIENAAIHGGAGPIEINARAYGDQFELSISDHGVGIPAAERDRVFERFHRLDPSRRGSGLGLAIASGFVTASHGEIRVTDRQDGLPGARIVITLPLVRDEIAHVE